MNSAKLLSEKCFRSVLVLSKKNNKRRLREKGLAQIQVGRDNLINGT
jgi:hypothetical protein